MIRAILRWLRTKRVCSWCQHPVTSDPFPRFRPAPSRFNMRGYMGGNPFASRITHGICPSCKAAVGRELMKRNVVS